MIKHAFKTLFICSLLFVAHKAVSEEFGCEVITELLVTKFKVDQKQKEEILDLLKGKSPEDFVIVEEYLKSMPPQWDFDIQNFRKVRARADVMTVLRTLATNDPQQTFLNLSTKPSLTPEEQHVFNVLVLYGWRISRWQRYSKAITDYIHLASPSRIIPRFYKNRSELLGENTALEAYLVNFDGPKYELLASIIRKSRNVGEVIERFEAKLNLIESALESSRGLRHLFYVIEKRKTRAFLALLKSNQDVWRKDFQTLTNNFSVTEWMARTIYPRWSKDRTEFVERWIVTIALVWGSGYIASHTPEWLNPFKVVYPEENILGDAYPEPYKEPTPEEIKQTEEILRKNSGNFEDLFKEK